MERPILIAELGSGGMADVFLAMRRTGAFVKLIVVKQLRVDALEGEAVAMFTDEARISARLNHPNVVQLHDVVVEGESYRLEMEYLDGQPLHRILHRAKKAGRAIPPNVSVAVIREVLAGLHYAHELADYDGSPLCIVHRDISPQNIFVTYAGQVKVVDFGIAKAAGQAAVTTIGMVKGKVRYMAPEQAKGGPIDRRADIFATGIVLWQLLTGQTYWGDADEMEVYRRLMMTELQGSPRSVRPDIPEALDAVVARALAPDPKDRFATAQDFAHALEDCMPPDAGATRWIGELASELFSDMRKAVRAEIEKVASRPTTTDDVLTKLVMASGAHSVASGEMSVVPGPPSNRSLAPTAPPDVTPAPPPPERKAWRAPLLAAMGIMAVASVVLGAMTFRRHSERARATLTAATVTATPLGAETSAPVLKDGPPTQSSASASAAPTAKKPDDHARPAFVPGWRPATPPGKSAAPGPAVAAPAATVDPAPTQTSEFRPQGGPSGGRSPFTIDRGDPWDAGAH